MLAITRGGGGGSGSSGSGSSGSGSSGSGSSGSGTCAWWDIVCQAEQAGNDIKNVFSGAPSYITKGIYPYLKGIPTIGANITDLESGLSGVTADVSEIPAIGTSIAGIYAGVKGVEALDNVMNKNVKNFANASNMIPTMMSAINKLPSDISTVRKDVTKIPSYFSGLETDIATVGVQVAGKLQPYFNTIDSGIGTLESGIGGVATDVGALGLMIQTKTKGLQSFMTNMVNVPSNVEKTVENTNQLLTLVSSEYSAIQDIPGDISSDYEKLKRDMTGAGSTIESGINTIEGDINKLSTQLKSLPKDIEKYVEDGVDTALNKLWKNIEIPVIVLGGLGLLMFIQPSSCCPAPHYRPHEVS
jgi:uncharacterized phage infection (PIP) family protein YhgE